MPADVSVATHGRGHLDRLTDINPARPTHPRRLVARIAAWVFSVVIALTCARWATAGGGWPGAAPSSQALPSLDGATAWINSSPLDAKSLRGKVVLVDFWTYSCINCLRTLAYVRAWSQKYASHGLVVIGAHTPEFEFERSTDNVRRAVNDLGIGYPVAVDSRQVLWNAFGARAWPTFYFVDAEGRIRYRQLGEGRYDQAERMIQQLLREAGRDNIPDDLVMPQAAGTQAAAGPQRPESDETFLRSARTEGFIAASGALKAGLSASHSPAEHLGLNQWTLAGTWKVDTQHVELAQAGGRIAYRFSARDLHLVLGPTREGRPVRFKVRVDGKAPGNDHGSDIDAAGIGRIDAQRLYQLVRQDAGGREHLFEIEFLDKGARAYAFTFG
jgi:thiol-disulfide isomerase/thioredoxin